MIACWFFVTWCDDCVFIHMCEVIVCSKAHKARLAVIALYVADTKTLIEHKKVVYCYLKVG